MGKKSVFYPVIIIACLCFIDSSSSCSVLSVANKRVVAIVGRNFSLDCTVPETVQCSRTVYWRNLTSADNVHNTNRTSTGAEGDRQILNIFPTTIYDSGLYQLSCVVRASSYIICNISLRLICQAEVVIDHHGSNLYRSTDTSQSSSFIINVTEGVNIKVRCPEMATSVTNCRNVMRRESGEFTYDFTVLAEHNSCQTDCQVARGENVICILTFSLNVSMTEGVPQVSTEVISVSKVSAHRINNNASTTVPYNDITQDSYSTMEENSLLNLRPGILVVVISACIVIVLIFGIACVIYFFFIRSTSESHSSKNVTETGIPLRSINETTIGPSGRSGMENVYNELDSPRTQSSIYQEANSTQGKVTVIDDLESHIYGNDSVLRPKNSRAARSDGLYVNTKKSNRKQITN